MAKKAFRPKSHRSERNADQRDLALGIFRLQLAAIRLNPHVRNLRVKADCALLKIDDLRGPHAGFCHDIENIARIFVQAVERTRCQQLVLDEIGFEWHARSFGLAPETKAFEDFWNVEAPTNVDIFEHAAQLPNVLVGALDGYVFA